MFNLNGSAQENITSRRQFLAERGAQLLSLGALVGVGYAVIEQIERTHERVEKLTSAQRDYLWRVVDADLSWENMRSRPGSEERLMATHNDATRIILTRSYIRGFGNNYRVDLVQVDKGTSFICNDRHGERDDLVLMRALFASAGISPKGEDLGVRRMVGE